MKDLACARRDVETGGALYEIGKCLGCSFLIVENFKIVRFGRSTRGRFRNDALKNRTNSAHPFLQRGSELFAGREPQTQREASQSVGVSRDSVRLLFALDLQTMLHASEEPVSVIQNQHFLARKQV